MKSPVPAKAPKVSFKQQMLAAREEAIVQTVNRLLAEKGFEAMTVDEVAQGVGIAKASLYKHFPSKEDLAAAAMVRVLHRTQAYLDTLPLRSRRWTTSKPWCAGRWKCNWRAKCPRCPARTRPCGPI